MVGNKININMNIIYLLMLFVVLLAEIVSLYLLRLLGFGTVSVTGKRGYWQSLVYVSGGIYSVLDFLVFIIMWVRPT